MYEFLASLIAKYRLVQYYGRNANELGRVIKFHLRLILKGIWHQLNITNRYLTRLKYHIGDVVDEFSVGARKYKGDLGGKEMQPFAAYACLTLKSGEIVFMERKILLHTPFQDQSLDQLGQQVLMVKGNYPPTIDQTKNYSDSQS